MSTGTRPPRSFIEPLDDLANRHPLLYQPSKHLSYQDRLILVDNQIAWYSVPLGNVAISVRRPTSKPVALTSLLELTTAKTLADHGSLVFSHGPLNLKEQLVLRIVRDRPVEKDDFTTSLTQFLEQQYLVSVLAREPVWAQNRDDLNGTQLHCIAQRVQCGAVQPGARIAIVYVDVFWRQFVVLLIRPSSEVLHLAVDRLLSALPLGGYSGIDRGAHRTPPFQRPSDTARWGRLGAGFGTPDGADADRHVAAPSPT
jgi:hypothetical protein